MWHTNPSARSCLGGWAEHSTTERRGPPLEVAAPESIHQKSLEFSPPREELELKNTETNVTKCARLKFSEKLKLHFWVLLNAHLKETPIAGLSECLTRGLREPSRLKSIFQIFLDKNSTKLAIMHGPTGCLMQQWKGDLNRGRWQFVDCSRVSTVSEQKWSGIEGEL